MPEQVPLDFLGRSAGPERHHMGQLRSWMWENACSLGLGCIAARDLGGVFVIHWARSRWAEPSGLHAGRRRGRLHAGGGGKAEICSAFEIVIRVEGPPWPSATS